MKIVKVTKVEAIKAHGNSRIGVGYAIEGPEVLPPKVGEDYWLEGYLGDNKGKNWTGYFHTSRVTAISQDPDGNTILHTLNSIYKIENK